MALIDRYLDRKEKKRVVRAPRVHPPSIIDAKPDFTAFQTQLNLAVKSLDKKFKDLDRYGRARTK